MSHPFIQPFAGEIKTKQVVVICPKCNGHVKAEIATAENFPFTSHNAHCKPCDNWIMESEWNEVGEEQ